MMKKKLKKIFLISGIGILSLLLLLVIFLLILYFNKSLVKGLLERQVTSQTGAKLEIGKLKYDFFPLDVQADSVKVFQKIEGIEIDVFLNKLSLRGGISRLLKKQKPFFQSIKAAGGICNVRIEEIEGQVMEIDYQKNMLLFSNFLSYVDRINLEDFSFKYITSSNSFNFENCRLFIANSGQKGEFNYSLSSDKALIKNISQGFILDSSCHLSGKLSFVDQPSMDGEILVTSLNFESIKKKFHLPKVAVQLKGEFPLDEKILFFPEFEMFVSPLLEASGYLKVDMSEELSLVFIPEIHLKNLENAYDLLKPYLEPYLSPELKALTVKGAVYCEGECYYVRTSSEQKTDIKGLVKLEPTQINCKTPSFSFNNSISGEIRAEGSLPDIKVSGSIKIQDGNFSTNGIEIRSFSLDIPVNGTSSFLETSLFKGSLKGLSFSPEGKKIELNQVEFSGQGSFDINRRKVDLKSFEFQAPPLPPVEISSRLDLNPQGERFLHLKSSEIDFAHLSALFSPFLPKTISEWEPSGQFNVDIKASYSPQGQNTDEWSVFCELDLSKGMFHNPSFTIAGEALHPKITLEGKYHSLDEALAFSALFNISKGESLWNEYYVDWSKNPFQGNVTGVYHIPLKKIDELSIEALFFSLGKINAKGLVKFQDPPFLDLEVSATQLGLLPLYSFFTQEQTPEQSSFDLKGEAESQVHFIKEENKLSLTGQILVKNGSVENKDKELLIDGIEVKIPVYYESRIEEDKEKESFLEKGYFRAAQIKTPFLSIAPLRVDFFAGKNKFMIEPFTAGIFGGTATLERSLFSIGSKPSDFKGTLSFSLNDVDISKFPIKSDQFSLSGTIQTDLSRVEINPEMITTEGRGEVNIFDTRITVQNIKITKPFSKNRTISCDVDFKDLNLEKLTDAIPFGKVTGILKGEIKDLAISYGQPERFVMLLESVERKGVPQKFSLGAVNDLSVISSGEGASISSKKGLTRFVSKFGYSKIGIFCSLKNDIFTLRGTVREKGVEYLVKRSWIFGISVVNKKPRNRIRFKDMMSRLKRIGRTQESK